MRNYSSLLAALHLLACIASAQTPTPSPTPSPTPTLPYQATDLGLYVYPVGINDHSQVVSTEYDFGYGVVVHYRGSPTYLTENGEYAIGINNSGQVIGTDYSDYFLWTPDVPNGVAWTPQTLDHQADGINDRGEIAGTSYDGPSPLAYRRSAAGSMTYFGTLGGSYTGATAINGSGAIVGRASAPAADIHGALWSATAAPSATPYDLGTLGGPSSLAISINDAGDIAGSSTTSLGSWDRAFLYTGGVMSNLGVISGDFNSTALDLNGGRDVVGFSESEEDGPRAFLYTTTGGLVNLNAKLPSGTDWTLTNANSINECGQIVGSGDLYDSVEEYSDTHGYLLTPPNTAMLYDTDPSTISGDAELEWDGNEDSTQLTSLRRCVRLLNLYATGKLDGFYASTNLTTSPVVRAEETDGIFDYTRSETGFEEVMAYYHTDAVKRYLNQLGFPAIRTHQVGIDASSSLLPSEFVSGYLPTTKGLYFKGRTEWIDAAEDPMTIWHENFHAILDDIKVGFGGNPLVDDSTYREAKAFNEGAADYWAASRFAGTGRPGHEHDWDVFVGRWIGNVTVSGFPTTPPTPRFLRRVDSTKVYPTDYLDEAGKIYQNGLIVSSTLWSIRQLSNLGRERTDRLLIRALELLPSTSARFRDFAKAFLAANEEYHSGVDEAGIKNVLTSKGLYFEIQSLTLSPTSIVGAAGSSGEVTGTVTLTGKAWIGGAEVSLTDTHAAASVPATVTVPENQTSATFTISTSAVVSTTSGNITATYDGKSVHANLDVTP